MRTAGGKVGPNRSDPRRAHAPADTRPARFALDACLLALLPFLELGRSYWLSVATLAAIVMLARARPVLGVGWRRASGWIVLIPAMFLPLLLEGGVDPVQDSLRIARQALIFMALLAIIRGSTLGPIVVAERATLRWLTILASGLLALTIVQFVALRSGHYFGLPASLYVQGQDTIPDALDLRYSHLRPAATYSEPSYLGFVMLSIALIAVPGAMRHGRLRLPGVVVACGLVAQAASFVLSIAILGTVAAWRMLGGRGRALLLALLAMAALAMAMAGESGGIVGRLAAGRTAGGDFSVFVRLFGPAAVLPGYLLNHPFGLPFSRLGDALAPYTAPLAIRPDDYLQNGLYNLFFEFGWLGLPIAAALLAVRDGLVRAYLGCCMIFNGGFLAIDKLAVIGFTLLLFTGLRGEGAGLRPGGRARRLAPA